MISEKCFVKEKARLGMSRVGELASGYVVTVGSRSENDHGVIESVADAVNLATVFAVDDQVAAGINLVQLANKEPIDCVGAFAADEAFEVSPNGVATGLSSFEANAAGLEDGLV